MLTVSALTGFVVGVGSAETVSTGSTVATGSSAAPGLPLWVPDATPIITASPAAASPSTSPAPTRPTPRSRTTRKTPAPTAPQAPSATVRDRELAAFLATSSETYADLTGAVAEPAPELGALPAVPGPLAPVPDPGTPSGPATDDPAPAAPAPQDPDRDPTGPQGSAAFTVASFNVLGSSHTRNGGRGRAPGTVRIRGAAQLLRGNGVDVAGFQELQADQARGLVAATDGSWALYPGAGPGRDSENSIGWRTDRFSLVKTRTISIPYFNGRRRQMPYVLLRHRDSGVQVWVANVHNPADTGRFHRQQRWRTQATFLEAGLARRLAGTGAPVLLTGDMNERAAFFCRFTSAAPGLVAAQGGSGEAGTCRPPDTHGIDWIFGSRGTAFSGYREVRGPLVSRTTDHPLVLSRAQVGTAAFPGSTGTVSG